MRVTKGRQYVYDPNGLDQIDARTTLQKGDVVTVVHPKGCPAPNTMKMCHVTREDGTLAGLVCTASLTPVPTR